LITPWYDGGAEWGGSAFDPANNRLILNANNESGILTLTEIPMGFSNAGAYATHCGSCHGTNLEGTETGPDLLGVLERMDYRKIAKVINDGIDRMPSFSHLSGTVRGRIITHIVAPEPVVDEPTTEVSYTHCCYTYLRDHEQLPGTAPPWGTLNSIDVASGEIVWSVPFGNYPSHPDLGLGAVSYGGPVVTASGLIFIAATPDMKFRAYDTRDGKILWQTDLTAAGFSTPAIYTVDGKQYVVISAGGGRMGPPSGADYFAYSLPD
jgi:quinoprotein glucose dehydrogenase